MPVPYAEIKWIKDRLDRVEKRVEELSKTQTQIRNDVLKLSEGTLETDKMLDDIFSDRCDELDEEVHSLLDRVTGIEAKIFPSLHRDIRQIVGIIGNKKSKPNNPLDKRKPRKPK